MNMREAWDKTRLEIAAGVERAASTWIKRHDNGAITIGQATGKVTLSQAELAALVDQVADDVLRAQTEAVLS